MNRIEEAFSAADSVATKLWKYGWGLLLVVTMTLFSQLNPRLSAYPAPTDATAGACTPAQGDIYQHGTWPEARF